MRVVGGALAGRRLAGPSGGEAEAARLRPTSDKIREALFNILTHGDHPPLQGARILDLFAGSGALAIEALSRGAESAVLVDDHPSARALIRRNLEELTLTGVAKVYRRDARRLGPHRGDARFTHLFVDPPYGRGMGEIAIAGALAGGWLAPEARVILEEGASAALGDAPDGLTRLDHRRYGDTQILIFGRDTAADPP
ncbi:MAG: 16S rRNA (guanine(966)-N(2))-methyltransferase RsmD [Pseudomonadota bacterium]